MKREVRSAAFVGTMNAMPMAYALELRRLGWDVKYFVDVPSGDVLSRPEFKFPGLTYPYPDWIVERRVRSQVVAALSPAIFMPDILQHLRRADVVFLSGLFLPLTKYLRSAQTKIFLSYGSDLDAWCNVESIAGLEGLFVRRIGRRLSRWVVRSVVHRMIESLKSVDVAVTFPQGLSAPGDRVIGRELRDRSTARIARYDISFADLPASDAIRLAPASDHLKIICGTRHTFRDHPGLTERENKGTDIAIRGIGKYVRSSGKRVEVHFFEKGLDLAEAKALCRTEGIDAMTVWHKETPFQEFLQLHQSCHIAFDQLGSHWVGAGMYAMYLSMPLIANSRREIFDKFWGEPAPVCDAQSEDDVVKWLGVLEQESVRREIGAKSRRFALAHFECTHTVKRIVEFLDKS